MSSGRIWLDLLVRSVRRTYELFIPFWQLGFWLFLATKLPKYYVIVCLLFLLSKARQAKRKSKVNHSTKMMKKPKTMLPKFVMSRALINIFSNTFSLFQLESKSYRTKQCWPYISYNIKNFFGKFFIYRNLHIKHSILVCKKSPPLILPVLITELSTLVEQQIKTNTFYWFRCPQGGRCKAFLLSFFLLHFQKNKSFSF